jgi:hypothetical protein
MRPVRPSLTAASRNAYQSRTRSARRAPVVSIVAMAVTKCFAMPSRNEQSEPSSRRHRIPFQPPQSVS